MTKKNWDIKQLSLLIVPFILLIVLGTGLMGSSDMSKVLLWFIVIFIFGIAAYPLSAILFKDHNSGGFFFGSVMGILLTSLIVWTLAYIKIPVFNTLGIAIILIAIAGFSYWYEPLRSNLIKTISKKNVILNVAIEETVFAFVLVVLCFYKGFFPDINGQEKFMDYGFIMSMLRSSVLPANDMWLSGYSINYYYFGQYIYALIIKLSNFNPGYGYTLSMCSAIAIPFGMCYSIAGYLIEVAKKNGLHIQKGFNIISGILMGLTVTIFGNSHSFFYDQNALGNGILKSLQSRGYIVGKIDGFFYPDSTRFIGYNPDSSLMPGIKNGADYTIEEFPFYSYLVGDLHAHVVSTMIVLLIVAVCIAALSRAVDVLPGSKDIRKNTLSDISVDLIKTELFKLITPEIIVLGVLLGVAQMTNYWDFLIYFIFCSMTFLILMTRRSADFSTVPGFIYFVITVGGILFCYLIAGSNPLLHIILQLIVFVIATAGAVMAPSALSRVSMLMSFVFTLAHIISIEFNMNFDMISNKIALCLNHSPLYQLIILWGTHVLIGVTFIVLTIFFKNYKYTKSNEIGEAEIYGVPREGFKNPVAKFFGERNIIDVFICGMVVVGLLLLIVPEIIYVRDIYTSGYLRSNTMFKFTYAGFIILSMAMAYIIVRLLWLITKEGNNSWLAFILSFAFLIMVLFVPGHYTLLALEQRSGHELKKEGYRTLDGTAYLSTYSSPYTDEYATGNLMPYVDAINWLNENVEGDPIICEAYGDSYTDNNIISAYTGLPTVCGWQTHEWLWRFHGIVDEETNLLISDPNYDVWQYYLTPRHTDIATIYTTPHEQEVQSIINKYKIEYIIIGDLERYKFGTDNTDVISHCGTIIFVSDDLMIVRTNIAEQ